MSEALNKLAGRAVTSPDFLQSLLEHPEAALQDSLLDPSAKDCVMKGIAAVKATQTETPLDHSNTFGLLWKTILECLTQTTSLSAAEADALTKWGF